jgi:hypothetical protein
MKQVLIGVAVTMVLLLERLVRAERRRRVMARRPPPDQPVEEHLSSSGRFKAVVYAYDRSVMRVEVFQWVENDPTAPFWLRISGPSFVDQRALPAVVHEALRAAGGDVVA